MTAFMEIIEYAPVLGAIYLGFPKLKDFEEQRIPTNYFCNENSCGKDWVKNIFYPPQNKSVFEKSSKKSEQISASENRRKKIKEKKERKDG